jgi:hypothetical protein
MTPLRRWLGLGLCALAVVSSGCNLLSLPFFLMGPEPSEQARLQRLATDDNDKKIKVAVLASSNLEVREQLARVDRELSARVIHHIAELCKHNKENVEVLPANVVERYKTNHPDWDRPLDLIRIGQDLHVRYVIHLEIERMSLFVPKSNNEFYQGNTDVKVTLVNCRKAADEPPVEDNFHEIYPESPRHQFDENPMAFRQEFLDDVAKKLAWEFTAHPIEDNYQAR